MDFNLKIIENLGEALTSGLNNVYDTAVDYADALSATAQLICGIAAMLYIGSKLWKTWAKGEAIDFYSMLRPFAVGLLILFFTGFTKVLDALIAPVEAATEYVRSSASERVNNSYTEYFDLQGQIMERKAQIEAANAAEQEKLSVWRTISKNISDLKDNVLNATENIGNAVFQFLVELGSVVVDIFSMATVYFYKIYVLTAKIVLVLIGPFALALSVFPGFKGNLKAWIAQYINVSLYIPICNIIGFVQSMVVSECFYAPGADSMRNILSQDSSVETLSSITASTTMIQICGMLLGIIAIMLYSHVPTFANWILKGDGSGGMAAAFSVGGGLAATKIGDAEGVSNVASKFGLGDGFNQEQNVQKNNSNVQVS
ncbi:MAG: hypothetical protein MJ009_01150 [Paludibacteraceae bacterium]|nr:hypothetical protein [Paludibacteraceae bacterium]